MMEDDLTYYRRRFGQEIAPEQASHSVEAAAAHRALAMIYADEIRRLSPDAEPPQLPVSAWEPAASRG
ncbi:hypothetical protein [Sphingomonas solaris]|uniref:Uncharacterized protein n=1 Tax=Alterirhizorhabdus solaris TaxID=2529389 RepID=A0A558R025_9SPHN|nr:hypothetical protein [Sphingomonas solaris]TVV72688.1 hypothetical protein FOY91_13910 [Sphingomonas solaris]